MTWAVSHLLKAAGIPRLHERHGEETSRPDIVTPTTG